MEAVGVLGRVDGGDDLVLVQRFGQRQLDQNGVDVGTPVKFGYLGQHGRRAGPGRKKVLLEMDVGAGAGLFLESNVKAGGRVVADQDHGQAGRSA